jgi:hypothetical protein
MSLRLVALIAVILAFGALFYLVGRELKAGSRGAA